MRTKKIIILMFLISVFFLSVSQDASASLQERFSKWDLNNPNSPLNKWKNMEQLRRWTEYDSAFKRLSNLRWDKPGGFKPAFARLTKINSNLAGSGRLNSQFTRMAKLSGSFSGGLKPSFTRLAKTSPALSGGLKPQFARLAQVSPAFSGALKPQFARLAQVSPAFSGALKPQFMRLAQLNRLSSYTTLNPSFTRLAKLSPSFLRNFANVPSLNLRQQPALSFRPYMPQTLTNIRLRLSAVKPAPMYSPLSLANVKTYSSPLAGVRINTQGRLNSPSLVSRTKSLPDYFAAGSEPTMAAPMNLIPKKATPMMISAAQKGLANPMSKLAAPVAQPLN